MNNDQAIKRYEEVENYKLEMRRYTELRLIIEDKNMPKLVEFMEKLKASENDERN